MTPGGHAWNQPREPSDALAQNYGSMDRHASPAVGGELCFRPHWLAPWSQWGWLLRKWVPAAVPVVFRPDSFGLMSGVHSFDFLLIQLPGGSSGWSGCPWARTPLRLQAALMFAPLGLWHWAYTRGHAAYVSKVCISTSLLAVVAPSVNLKLHFYHLFLRCEYLHHHVLFEDCTLHMIFILLS